MVRILSGAPNFSILSPLCRPYFGRLAPQLMTQQATRDRKQQTHRHSADSICDLMGRTTIPANTPGFPDVREICNQQVVGSNPTAGSIVIRPFSSRRKNHAWTLLGHFRDPKVCRPFCVLARILRHIPFRSDEIDFRFSGQSSIRG